MTNQQIVDSVEDALPSRLPARVKDKILDAVFDVLNDTMGMDLEPRSSGPLMDPGASDAKAHSSETP